MSTIPSQQRPVIDLTADEKPQRCFPRMHDTNPKVDKADRERLGSSDAVLANALMRR